MKRYIKSQEDIFAMSNVRGKYVTVDPIQFSFYYSVKNSNHGPRVKVTTDPEKLRPNRMSTMKLCDDWSIEVNPLDNKISGKDEKSMREFFRKYLILFLLVWEDLTYEPNLADYMTGDMTLSEFIRDLDFYKEYTRDLDSIETVADLEQFCRDNKLVSFYGN